MGITCKVSALMAMQTPLDAVSDMRYAIELLRELSLQKIDRANSAKLCFKQLQATCHLLECAIDDALTTLCQCAEIQQDKTPEKWADLTFDQRGHCSKCGECGKDSGALFSRMVDGRKVWAKPLPDDPAQDA